MSKRNIILKAYKQHNFPNSIKAAEYLIENNSEFKGWKLESLSRYCRKAIRGNVKEDVGIEEKINKWDEKPDDSAFFHYEGTKSITTLQEALDYCKADLEKWDVERYLFNSWDASMKVDNKWVKTTNYQVKVWFKPKSIKLEQLFDDFCENIQSVSPYRKKTNSRPKNCLLEIDIFDPHFGKYAVERETGDAYDIKIARTRYEDALNKIVNRTKDYDIGKILYPVGNDWFHTDSFYNTTTKGTPQDTDLRWWETWEHGCEIALSNINFLSEIAPVEIKIVLSNHDWQNIFKMGYFLNKYYENNENVTVDADPKSRKYYRWGDVGIGFAHGNEEKHNNLPYVMLSEKKKDWADVKVMEWHLGHEHRQKRIDFKGLEEQYGVIIRFMRSLSSADFWHHKNGYIGNLKGAEGFIWHKKEHMVGNFPVVL